MLDQKIYDEIADRLVEEGVKVTYESVNLAHQERDRLSGGPGHGKSYRDLVAPYADWKRRRRYRPHLAGLAMNDAMDLAIAGFIPQVLKAARKTHVPEGRDEAHDPPSSTEQFDGVLREMRSLRERMDAMANGGVPPKRLRGEERRRGLAAATGRFFWDRMMQHFVEAIRENGPMTSVQLLGTLDEDALAMAEAAFEEVTTTLIKEKVDERVKKGRYFRLTPDDAYDVLRKHAARKKPSATG